jgi:hypothetical protein
MMTQQRRVRGSATSEVSHSPEDQRVMTGIGEANFSKRGISLGAGKDGELAGSHDAVYVEKVLEDSADQVLTLPHALGRVPTWATLWELASLPGLIQSAAVQSHDKTAWTKTTIRVRVLRSTGSGSLAGARMKLLVGG